MAIAAFAGRNPQRRAALIAAQIRADVAGMSRCVTPVGASAFMTAFMIVAGDAIAPA